MPPSHWLDITPALFTTGGKPSTWLPPGGLVEQSAQRKRPNAGDTKANNKQEEKEKRTEPDSWRKLDEGGSQGYGQRAEDGMGKRKYKYTKSDRGVSSMKRQEKKEKGGQMAKERDRKDGDG